LDFEGGWYRDIVNDLFGPYLQSQYREDIQGIRAIGAILIMVYHIWIQKVSGGVDVFFVVSGFLMTGLLLRQFAREGRILPFQFWGQIVKRIAPSAYLVLLATIVLGFFFLPPPFWRDTLKELVFSAAHLENFQLMRTGVDYLARTNPPSPVQQFWALSMQVQFYVLLPILVVPLVMISARLRTLWPLLAGVISILIASFVYSVVATSENPTSAYFNTGARIWEFLAGALVALVLPWLRLGARAASILGFVGLFLLLGTGIFVPAVADFPGFVALLPVVAAMLLIVSGASPTHQSATGSFLASGPLVFIGASSFTIYLWHWPLFIYAQHHYDTTSLSFLQGMALMAAATGLALLTTKIVETPFRRIPKTKPLLAYAVGIVFFVPTVAAALGGMRHLDDLTREMLSKPATAPGVYFTGHAISIQDTAEGLELADFAAVKFDMTRVVKDGCQIEGSSRAIVACEFGDTSSDTVVALVGGSHASQWESVFSGVGQRHGFKLVTITRAACTLGYLEWLDDPCRDWNAGIVEKLAELEPLLVITISTRLDRFGRMDKAEYIPDAYVQKWAELNALGIPVLGIRDNPWFEQRPNACAWDNMDEISVCARPVEELFLEVNPAEKFAEQMPLFHSADFTHFFCADGRCPVYFDGKLMWRDSHHLTDSYMKYISLAVERSLGEQLPGLLPGIG
jgi:peptidoglycan/LPS O-acetylase OafA/YrhL